MTFDISDIISMSKPSETHIQTTNKDVIPVKGGGGVGDFKFNQR